MRASTQIAQSVPSSAHLPSTPMFMPPVWNPFSMWHGAPVGPGMAGFPMFAPPMAYARYLPVEDVPRPPQYPPPESPRFPDAETRLQQIPGLQTTPGGTPVPPPPPPQPVVAFAEPLISSTGYAGSPAESLGNRVPGLEEIEEPSRLVMSLPALDVSPGTQDASVAAGDWVARIKPLLTTLSPSAHKWWDETHSKAYEFYQQWLTGQKVGSSGPGRGVQGGLGQAGFGK